jgi:hypothetical protein
MAIGASGELGPTAPNRMFAVWPRLNARCGKMGRW